MSSFFVKPKNLKKKECSFILRDIDMATLDTKFNMDELSKDLTPIKKTEPKEIKKKKKEKINDENDVNKISGISSINGLYETSLEKLGISSFRKEPLTTILTKEKTKLQTYITMIDLVNKKKLPIKTNIPCHGCRRKFSSQPIGIPIKYYPSEYASKNDPTKIKKLTINERKTLENTDKKDQILFLEYFDCEGIICSFNCIYLAIEESPSPIYKETTSLIPKMYNMIFGIYPVVRITKSPSWKLREEYGGPLNDIEYEKSLQIVQFTDTEQIYKVQKLIHPVGKIFDVKDVKI